MKIIPVQDRVLIKLLEPAEISKGGIVLPSSAKDKSTLAEVLAVGPGGMVDGNEVVMTVKPGDKVVTAKFAGYNVILEQEEFFVVRMGDILGTVVDD